jgi:hypothetical protein
MLPRKTIDPKASSNGGMEKVTIQANNAKGMYFFT